MVSLRCPKASPEATHQHPPIPGRNERWVPPLPRNRPLGQEAVPQSHCPANHALSSIVSTTGLEGSFQAAAQSPTVAVADCFVVKPPGLYRLNGRSAQSGRPIWRHRFALTAVTVPNLFLLPWKTEWQGHTCRWPPLPRKGREPSATPGRIVLDVAIFTFRCLPSPAFMSVDLLIYPLSQVENAVIKPALGSGIILLIFRFLAIPFHRFYCQISSPTHVAPSIRPYLALLT